MPHRHPVPPSPREVSIRFIAELALVGVFIVGGLLIVALLGTSYYHKSLQTTRPPVTLPPCQDEDAASPELPDCWWDATSRGDGKGRSFANIGGRTYYLQR